MSAIPCTYFLGDPIKVDTLCWLDISSIFFQPAKAGDSDIHGAWISQHIISLRSPSTNVWQLFLTKLYFAFGEVGDV